MCWCVNRWLACRRCQRWCSRWLGWVIRRFRILAVFTVRHFGGSSGSSSTFKRFCDFFILYGIVTFCHAILHKVPHITLAIINEDQIIWIVLWIDPVSNMKNVIKEERCYYCSNTEHSIITIDVGNRDIGTTQGRLCENCGHLGLFCGGDISAYAPNEINPVRLPEIIRQIRNKYPSA